MLLHRKYNKKDLGQTILSKLGIFIVLIALFFLSPPFFVLATDTKTGVPKECEESSFFIQRADENGELFAFIPSKQGLNVNLSMGGTKLAIAIIDSKKNVIAETEDYLWRDQFIKDKMVSNPIEVVRHWVLEKIVHQISISLSMLAVEEIGRVEGLGIAWPGPVSIDGLVFGSNVEGFKPHQLTAEEKASGISLAKLINKKIEQRFGQVNWKISVLNDGDAAAKANFCKRGISDGILLTIGTGIGSGIIIDKEVLFNPEGFEERVGELGHHIYYHPIANRFFYYGVETKGRILFEMGKYSLGQRLSGPILAKRFLQKLRRERNNVFEYSPIKFSEQELAVCEKGDELDPILEKKILQLITINGNNSEPCALSFIEEIGYELGLALGVFIKEFETEPFKKIILSGGIGRNFGRGVFDESGEDLFLKKFRQGIEWSQQNHNTEMNKLIFGNFEHQSAAY